MQTSSINRQRGSIIIPFAVSLVVGLILLGGVQLAYYFFMKRELQNAADMAALSAVQLIEKTGELTCNNVEHPAQKAAEAIIKENFQYGVLSNMTVSCGVWDPVKYAEKEGHFTKIEDEEDNVEYNAILVDLTYDAIGFMPFSTDATIRTKAIAKKSFQPVAVFSVGPSLLEIDNGALNNTLSAVGLNLFGTNIGSFKGLADAKIKTSGLLENILGKDALEAVVTVGDLNTLLDTEVGLGQIMVAAVKAADSENVVGLTLLEAIGAELDSLTIPLGSVDENGRGGLFAHIKAPSAKAALDTMVGVGDILNVVLGVATKNKAIDLPLNVDLGLLRADVKVGVIEPPSIGIGGPGTTAYSASVRAFLRLCADLNASSCESATGGFLSGLLELKVDIPVGIEAVTGKATLGPMCEKKDEVSGKPIAEITTDADFLGLCIGDITQANVFSNVFSCTAPKPASKDIAALKTLGINLLTLSSSAAISALPTEGTEEYIEGDVEFIGNKIDLNLTVSDLVSGLLNVTMGTNGTGWENSTSGQDLWDAQKTISNCDPGDDGFSGYQCRKSMRYTILNGLEQGLNGLVGELVDDILKGKLLTGVVKVVGGLVNGLINIVGIDTDPCTTKWTLLGIGYYGGDESACVVQIDEVLNSMKNSEVQDNDGPVPALLALITGILEPLLTMLGGEDGVLTKLLDSLGLEVNKVRTELISLDCDSAAQLVY